MIQAQAVPGSNPSSKPPVASASLPPATRRRVEACFERGKQLALKREVDYAHDMFVQCVMLDPSSQPCAEALLQNLRAKFGDDKNKVSRMARLGGTHDVQKAIAREGAREVLKLGLQRLQSNPWHAPTLRGLAEACAALHHDAVELVFLKQALEAAPRDAEVNRHCARSLARMKQFDQAIACWHRVETIQPRDAEATRMISKLSEEKIWHAAELREQAAQSRPQTATPDKQDQSASKEQTAPKEIRLSPRQLLERAIAECPLELSNYLELAKLLVEEERLAQAESVLAQCLATCGDIADVRKELEMVRSLRLARQQESAVRQTQRKPRWSVSWLEIALAVATMALVVQLVPNVIQLLLQFVVVHRRAVIVTGSAMALVLLSLLRAWQQRTATR